MRIVGIALVGLILFGTVVAEEEKPVLPKPTEVFENDDLRIERYEIVCNTYLLLCAKTGEFVCLDPSPGIGAVIAAKVAEKKPFKAVWITHEHGDHLAGLAEVLEQFEVPSITCEEGKKAIEQTAKHWEGWGFKGTKPPPVPDTIIQHGDEVKVGKLTFQALFLPGHSRGSIGYYRKDRVLFAGDVLFRGSIGRTDLPTSDPKVFAKSLADHLWDLPDAVDVFPGHGDRTTMKRERKMNWLFQDFVRAGRGEKPIERPWFGIGIDRQRKEMGLKLTAVTPGSPAEKCGLKAGDVITKMGDTELAGVDDFMKVFMASKVGEKVPLVVMRGEKELEVTIEFAARPRSPEKSEPGLIGRWRTVSIVDPKKLGPVAAEMEFKSDGTYRDLRDDRFGVLDDHSGTYEIEGKTLRLKPAWARSAFAYTWWIEEGRLVLTSPDREGWVHTLERSADPHPKLVDLPKVPHTVEEAVAVLRQVVSKENLEKIRKMKKEDVHGMHFGLGLYIRNAFGLWRDNKKLLKSCGDMVHPDDASGVILEALWKDLQED